MEFQKPRGVPLTMFLAAQESDTIDLLQTKVPILLSTLLFMLSRYQGTGPVAVNIDVCSCCHVTNYSSGGVSFLLEF